VPQADSLRVRKNTVEVRLALAGSPPRRVELFLAEQGWRGFSQQRVLDLLEQDDCFLPARDLETGGWETLNARAVVWIGVSRLEAEAESSGDELFDYRKLVRVELEGCDALEGEILYSAPETSARVVDVLNRRERFLRLWSGDRVFLVNKGSILRVVEATISGR
jgi:hypothetical protein